MAGVAVWCGSSAAMWSSHTLSQQLFWSRAQDLGIWVVPVAFLALALGITGVGPRPTRVALAVAAVVSFAASNVEWLNPGGLFDVSFVPHAIGEYIQYRIVLGPLYWVLVVVIYSVVLLACAMIFRVLRRGSGDARRRAAILLVGGLVPLVVSAVTQTGLITLEFDLAPLAFVITGGLWLTSILSGDLLGILPLARDLVVQQMSDGVIVIDPDGYVADANPAAMAILGVHPGAMIGRAIGDVLGPFEEAQGFVEGENGPATRVLRVWPEAEARYLRFDLLPLTGFPGTRPARLLTVRDITAMRMAHAQEARLAAVVASSQDAIFTTDLDGKVTTWNAGAESVYGYSAGEIVGASVALLMAPGREGDIREVAELVLAHGHLSNFEAPRRRRDGQLIEVSHSYAAILDERGRPVAVSVIGHDVTKRNTVERERRQSEEKFAAAFRATPDLVSITRASDGMILEVNEGYRRLLGYDRQESVGRCTSDLALWVDSADRDRFVAALSAKGWVEDFETRLRRKDGTIIAVSDSARTFELQGEECVLSVVHDITLRRQSEQSLKRANLRFEGMVHDVVEAMGRIIEVRDPYTQGHQLKVMRIAKAIAEELLLSADEIEAIEMAALVHDIGKLSVPADILTKPGRLSDAEFALIKEHPRAGYAILKGIDFPWPVADIVLAHHERRDGSGYPDGLAGDDISMAARVVAVADVVDAMSSHRPYRPTLGPDAAVMELKEHGEKYDPAVVAAYTALHERGQFEA
jgi:PAS domain S-box-containing protein/putative nucleotidyltransferase with HDIG domain